jgi:hypothetical protein
MGSWTACEECGERKLIRYGDVCDDCLDERWPDALAWADADHFEEWLFCVEDVDPGDEETCVAD